MGAVPRAGRFMGATGAAAGWRADLELMVAGSDDWWPDGTGEPAFGAGLTLSEPLYEALAADEDWVDGLDTDGITIAPFQDNTRVYRTLPVRELLTAGGTLEEQARALAEWASQSFRLVGEHKPSEAFEPTARRRRRRSGANEEHDKHLTQPVTAADIAGGRVRIARGSAKGLTCFLGGPPPRRPVRGRRVWDVRTPLARSRSSISELRSSGVNACARLRSSTATSPYARSRICWPAAVRVATWTLACSGDGSRWMRFFACRPLSTVAMLCCVTPQARASWAPDIPPSSASANRTRYWVIARP